MTRELATLDGLYLAADQDDGNFVVYRAATMTPLWDRFSHEASLVRDPLPDPVPAVLPVPVGPDPAGRLIPVTDASDGAIEPRMYSYWANTWLNPAGDLAHVFWGHADGHPRFAVVMLPEGKVQRLGSLLPYTGTSEGWYWDREGWIYLLDGPRLRRCNPFTSEDRGVFDISDTHPGCDLWQAHSSDDGRVHSATVRQVVNDGPYPLIGTVVCRDGQQTYYPADAYALDESQITPDGAYLVIKSSPDDDNLIVTLATGEQRWLQKSEGALGHSDCGPGFMVGADRDHEPRACVRWNLDQPLTPEHRVLLTKSGDWSGGDLGHVAVRGYRLLVSDSTHICLGDMGDWFGLVPILVHGMVGDDYDHQVKANLDPSGRLATFMSNYGTDRQDVYLLVL